MYSLSVHANFIAIAKIPIGRTYFIIPIIPPSISLNFIPITPDFPYISTINKTLNIINPTTAKSIFDALLFDDFVVFLFLYFLFAIIISSKNTRRE